MKGKELSCKTKGNKWNKEWNNKDYRNKNKLVKQHNVYSNSEKEQSKLRGKCKSDINNLSKRK